MGSTSAYRERHIHSHRHIHAHRHRSNVSSLGSGMLSGRVVKGSCRYPVGNRSVESTRKEPGRAWRSSVRICLGANYGTLHHEALRGNLCSLCDPPFNRLWLRILRCRNKVVFRWHREDLKIGRRIGGARRGMHFPWESVWRRCHGTFVSLIRKNFQGWRKRFEMLTC